jgi:3-methyladenine DNA glycosylase Tag
MDYRCGWPGNDPLMIDYHDREWGVHPEISFAGTVIQELSLLI